MVDLIICRVVAVLSALMVFGLFVYMYWECHQQGEDHDCFF